MYKRSKLLIVDDVEINRILLTEIFKNEYEIIHAENGLQALEIVNKYYKDISVIIVDIVMPVMNGFELLNLLKGNPSYESIVKLVISGANDEDNRKKAIECGAFDLIVKPFDPSMIKEKVNRIVSRFRVDKLKEENDKLKKYLCIRTKIEELTDDLPGGIVVFEANQGQDHDINILYVNKYIYNILGYQSENLDYFIRNDAMTFFQDDINNLIKLSIMNSMTNKSDIKVSNFRIKDTNGKVIWFDISAKMICCNESTNTILYYGIFYDVSERIKREKELNHRLKYDVLTEIYNKELFFMKTQELLITNMDKQYVIICLNVEKLKLINELYGISEGDKVLIKIADLMKINLPKKISTYGRLYSDYFALCIEKRGEYLERLTYLARDGLDNYNLDFKVNIKLGIYEVTNHTVSVHKMCDMAIMAIDSIKGNFKKMYNFFEENMKSELLNEQEIINDMNMALKERQFEVFYQPKFNLKTNKMIGAEALVRWNHPRKGCIQPSKFLNTFEKIGFITAIDEYVIENVFCQVRKWIDKGINPLPISINISRKDIYRENFISIIKRLLFKYSVPPSLIHIEITETAYTENASQLLETVIMLKKLGFIIEMDDFGSGYSSLNMLNEIPVDILKLDMKFLGSPKFEYNNNKKIMQSIIYMANLLNLEVIAEGIETKSQVDYLLKIGCHIGQGFFFAKPLKLNEFEKFIK